MRGWRVEKPDFSSSSQQDNLAGDSGADLSAGSADGQDFSESGSLASGGGDKNPAAEPSGGSADNEDVSDTESSTADLGESEAAAEDTPDSAAEGSPEAGGGIEERPGGTEGGLTAEEKMALAAELAGGASSSGVEEGSVEYSEQQGMDINPATGKDKYLTDPVPEGKPVPVEPQDVEIGTTEYSCTISISCSTINDNISWLDPEKVELVPEDGWILPATTVIFYEGESVFNVLLRTCKQMGIHMEFENTPMYNSAYVEGINNLYEFDCGELSGWMYKVNEWFPNYGSSRYQLKDGDVICWVYTCNLGFDVGGGYATGM